MRNVPTTHYFSYISQAMQRYWDKPILTDYESSVEYTFSGLAAQIANLSVLFDVAGIKEGEKIAICAKSCSNWAATFLAIAAAKRVVVSILPDYAADDIHFMINHSDSRLLFTDKYVYRRLQPEVMSSLECIIDLEGFEWLYGTEEAENKFLTWNETFEKKYPNGISQTDINYPIDNLDELAVINYTSGTTGSPKGVMLSHRNLSSNVTFGQVEFPSFEGENILSILPLSHIFGLMYEFLYQIAGGIHIFYLTKAPTPANLMRAFKDVKPYMMMSVPLIIEKIVTKKVMPTLAAAPVSWLWRTPLLDRIVANKVRKEMLDAFGGRLQFVIIGGAAFSEETEAVLKKIGFPYTCGYGLTECAPLVSYLDWHYYKPRSVGRLVDRMEVKVSGKAESPSEILLRGENVMMGYYKNEQATADTFTKDGWFRTGDMGYIDNDGNLFVSGRCKTMILGASGQNIYPEEIETKISTINGVVENLVVERDGKLISLIYPEPWVKQQADRWQQETLLAINKRLPAYSRIAAIEIQDTEFKKTPKQSIKRILYK